ncbi:MAG TPA: signal peptidase I [Ktedonobacterales bacterium]|jgi:signal peptidase I
MSKERADRLEFASGPPLPKKQPAERNASQRARPGAAPRKRYQRRDPNEPKRLRLLREVLETVTLTILMFMAFRFAVQNYRVDGHSMVPTFQDQEYILVDKAAYLFHPPERGDVIVFAYPLDPTQDYIKRVIGVPGDHVQVTQDGTVSVNGVQLPETYINNLANPYPPTDLIVCADHYFVLGDNRGDSSDSRAWGLVPRNNIVGKASLVYWPIGSFHTVPSAQSVFAAVHSNSRIPACSASP